MEYTGLAQPGIGPPTSAGAQLGRTVLYGKTPACYFRATDCRNRSPGL